MSSALRWRLFAFLAISINLVAFLMVRLTPRPAVGIGAALDVAVTVPALYFLLVVRAGLQPLISLVPVLFLGMLRATYLAPGMHWTRPAIGAAAELAICALIVARLRRGWRAASPSLDILARIEIAAAELVPVRPIAAILASEIAVFYYAFGSWRQPPDVPAGSRAFSIHHESGAAVLFAMLAGVSVVEAALVHLVVARWSLAAAWALTALSLYGMVWLVATARSFVLRPVLLASDEVIARCGLLWTVRIPRHTVSVVAPSAGWDVKMPPAAEPNVVLQLAEPATAYGMYGRARRVSRIALAVDDPTGFNRALHHEI